MTTVKAGYTCRHCRADTTDVEVREKTDAEPIENYVHHIARMCGEHHDRTRRKCPMTLGRVERALDIKIPMTKAGIGKAGEPLSPEEQRELGEGLGG